MGEGKEFGVPQMPTGLPKEKEEITSAEKLFQETPEKNQFKDSKSSIVYNGKSYCDLNFEQAEKLAVKILDEGDGKRFLFEDGSSLFADGDAISSKFEDGILSAYPN